MEKIKKELTEIAEKYKKDFDSEVNGEKVFKTIIDISSLIDDYELKLKDELQNTVLSQSKYIDSNDKIILEKFIRSLLIDFRKFASAFL